MAGKWLPLLMVLGGVVIAAGVVYTIRRGVIEYLFLHFRRDEGPIEFWVVLLVTTAGAVGVLYVLLV